MLEQFDEQELFVQSPQAINTALPSQYQRVRKKLELHVHCIEMSTAHISQWKGDFEETPLTRESFIDLLDGKIPYIREAQFLGEDVSRNLEDILSPQLKPYLHATGPQLLKIGVAQFEFQAQSEADVVSRTDDGMSVRAACLMGSARTARLTSLQRSSATSRRPRRAKLYTTSSPAL